MRKHAERNGSSCFIPNTVIIARDDAKGVIARRYICVRSSAPRAGVHPIGFKPRKAVAKANLFRHCETEAGVTKLEPLPPWGDSQRPRARGLFKNGAAI